MFVWVRTNSAIGEALRVTPAPEMLKLIWRKMEVIVENCMWTFTMYLGYYDLACCSYFCEACSCCTHNGGQTDFWDTQKVFYTWVVYYKMSVIFFFHTVCQAASIHTVVSTVHCEQRSRHLFKYWNAPVTRVYIRLYCGGYVSVSMVTVWSCWEHCTTVNQTSGLVLSVTMNVFRCN